MLPPSSEGKRSLTGVMRIYNHRLFYVGLWSKSTACKWNWFWPLTEATVNAPGEKHPCGFTQVSQTQADNIKKGY